MSTLLLLAPLLAAQPAGVTAGVTATAAADRSAIRLSESVRVVLTLEGPAPLRVDLPDKPEQLLTDASRPAWRIAPAGPAKVEPLPDGRERWSQTYRLDPFLAGEKLPVAFAPVKVTAGGAVNPQEVTWPAVAVTVELTGWTTGDGKPVTRKNLTPEELEAARGKTKVTGIEDLPPAPPPDRGADAWPFVAGLGVVFAAVLLAVLVRRWRARPPPLPPAEWAARELGRLDGDLAAGRIGGGEVADRVAAVLRGYVERRFGLPAPRLTTSELLAGCEKADWPAEPTAALRELLDRCDRAKFAGDTPDDAEAAALVARAREWVGTTAPASRGT